MRKLGQMLRDMRKLQQISQQEVAKVSGVSQSELSKFENEKLDIRQSTLQKIALAIDMRVMIVPKEYELIIHDLIRSTQEAPTHSKGLLDIYGVSDDKENDEGAGD